MATILVVDDEADLEVLIKQKFRKKIRQKEYEFLFAENGVVALQKIAENPEVDIVLSDINMPVMNGIELVKQLRQLEAYKYTPILMLTTETSSDRKMAGKGAGATGWVVKPFNPDKLLATIKKVIS